VTLCYVDVAADIAALAVDGRRARHPANGAEITRPRHVCAATAEARIADAVATAPRTHGQDACHRPVHAELPRPAPAVLHRQASSVCRSLYSSIRHCLCPNKYVHLVSFEYFGEKSANFYNVWCTHMVDIFDSVCNFACLKFQLLCCTTVGYMRRSQFFRETSIFHKVQW